MSANDWLKGVFPPIPTAFAANGSWQAPPSGFLNWLAQSGLDGVVALGSNGEAVHLTEAERTQMIRSVKNGLPKSLRLIAGTGAESTVATIERTKRAADEGADAALVIAPSYYRRQLTLDALRRHFNAVAQSSPIPILIYNVPANMGYDLGAEWMAQLAGHPNIAGIKDSSGDTSRLPGLRQSVGKDFILLAGSGEKMLDELNGGADGGIIALANLAPAACAAIRKAWLDGRMDQARQLQGVIAPIGEALSRGYGVPGLKAGLRLLGYDHGDPRPPVPPLAASEVTTMRRLLENAQLLPRALAS
jgi:4-hydroxy-2-oxoglutarate aldolase